MTKKTEWATSKNIAVKGGSLVRIFNESDFQQWTGSVNITTAAIIDWSGGLRSLDELVDNADRKNLIKSAINKYLSRQCGYGYLISGCSYVDGNKTQITWGMTDGDLKQDISGEYLYANDDNNTSTTTITFCKTANPNASDSYFIVGGMNKYDNITQNQWGDINCDCSGNDTRVGNFDNKQIVECVNSSGGKSRKAYLNLIKATDSAWNNRQCNIYLVVGGYVELTNNDNSRTKRTRIWGSTSDHAQLIAEGMLMRDDQLNWCSGKLYLYLVLTTGDF